jgi:hypothetical protein
MGKVLLGLTVIIAALSACVVFWMRSFAGSMPDPSRMCGESVFAQRHSPDKRYVAAVLRRGCGVAGGDGWHVNLRENARGFQEVRRGVIDDGWVFGTRSGPDIDLIWKDARHLVIRATLADPRSQVQSWKDVTISYEPVPILIRHQQTGAVLRTVLNLWGADLRGAQLAGADLYRVNMNRCDLKGANLRGANLGRSRLKNSDLRGADLRDVNFDGAELDGALYSPATRCPKWFDLSKHGAILVK